MSRETTENLPTLEQHSRYPKWFLQTGWDIDRLTKISLCAYLSSCVSGCRCHSSAMEIRGQEWQLVCPSAMSNWDYTQELWCESKWAILPVSKTSACQNHVRSMALAENVGVNRKRHLLQTLIYSCWCEYFPRIHSKQECNHFKQIEEQRFVSCVRKTRKAKSPWGWHRVNVSYLKF